MGAHTGAPLRQITTNHNVGADRCVCPDHFCGRSLKTEGQKEQKNKCTPPHGNSLPASPYSLFKKRESLKEKKTQTNGRTRRCAPTAKNNTTEQRRGRPMCLPGSFLRQEFEEIQHF